MRTKAAPVSHICAASCLPQCPYRGSWRWHHDRLLRVTWDHAELLDLLELAMTWHELDYAAYSLIEPSKWEDFLAVHRWQDHERAARVFHLAHDIAMRSLPDSDPGRACESVFGALTGQRGVGHPVPVPPGHV